MSLMGIDIGTTACKVMAMTVEGQVIALEQCEYDIVRPQPTYAEMDTVRVWDQIQAVIRAVNAKTAHDPVSAISVTSMGESVIPVTKNRDILGNAIMGFDARGSEALANLQTINPIELHQRSGNIATSLFGGPKILWLRDHEPGLFARADKFLNWADFVTFMLGAEPTTDFALANRWLFLDLQGERWSQETLDYVGMPLDKLPRVAQAGTVIGQVSSAMGRQLGLAPGVQIVLGTHDQCAMALGCGVACTGRAVYNIGTFVTITPAYERIPPTEQMMTTRLNVEHHAVPGLYVSFYYNLTGGSLLKWFRDTFSAVEYAQAQAAGENIYDRLLAEIPDEPTRLVVLPHFGVTGPPAYDDRPFGLIAGLTLSTSRGEFIRGLLEGVTYYFRQGVDLMHGAGIQIDEFRAVGGGARSDRWLQIKADILGKPLARPRFTEAGVLGTAILAGLGSGIYSSVAEPMEKLVEIERVFEPNPRFKSAYDERFAQYQTLYPAAQTIRDAHKA